MNNRKHLRITLLLSAILAAFGVSSSAQSFTRYEVGYSLDRPAVIHIVITPMKPMRGPVALVIPRAVPSGYAAQYYDRFVENVTARTKEGAALPVEREDGPRWRIGKEGFDVLRIEYDVDVERQEREITDAADTSKMRSGYVGILGYSALGYIEGTEPLPVSVWIKGPGGWPVFSTLSPKMPADQGDTTGKAENFFALADSQIIMGPKLKIRRLDVAMPVFLAVYTETETDLGKHSEVLANAFRTVFAYFGDAPFDHYTAYIEILKPLSDRHEYGFSMEHLESSTYFLGLDRAYGKETEQRQFVRDGFNFVHHLTHSWIPKKVYGTGYLPFTWELPPIIDTIWFNEGFARQITIEAIADEMSEDEGRQFRARQLEGYRKEIAGMPEFIRSMPLLELSRIGSTMYSGDFRTGRTLFMKGALMADEMDRLIRKRTNGTKRLRDSLRSLVKWGERTKRPFKINELPGLIAEPVGVDEEEIRAIMERWLARREN